MLIYKKYLSLAAYLICYVLVACSLPGGTEPMAEPTPGIENGQPEGTLPPEDKAEMTVADCPEAAAGAHQLIYEAQGICFLYPDHYDVLQADDGSLTLYVGSLLNTEAPLATVRMEAVNGRTIQAIIPDYPSEADLANLSFLTVNLGGEQATVLDMLPGQDANRRVIALYDDRRIVDIMIARVGEEYGEVGQQAEELYQMMVDTFQFIPLVADAPLLAGPECPEATVDRILVTHDEDGYCLLLPSAFAVALGNGQMTVYVESVMNTAAPRLFINVEDANGRTLEDVTAEKQEAFAGFEVLFSFGYMLDGVPANQFDQLPGQDLNRQVVLVHNDRFYTLTFVPDDPSMGDVYDEMQTLYTTVMDSFSFLRES